MTMIAEALDRRWQSVLLAIVGLSVALRLIVALLLGNQVEALPGIADQVSYHTLAMRVLDGHGFTFGEPWWPATQPNMPTAHWSYLYTLFLVAVYGVVGEYPLVARLLQVGVVGALMPLLAFGLGQKVFNRRTGLVAAALTAGYAYFIYYAAALMTETFFICAVLGVLYLAIRLSERWQPSSGARPGGVVGLTVAFGLTLGAAILLRQVFLLFVPVLLAWLGWLGLRRQRGREAVAVLAGAGALAALLILPFTLFNYARFGEFVLLNTNAGYAFYYANHPVYGDQFEPILSGETANYRDILPPELMGRGLSEAELERELMQRGLGFIVDDPLRYVRLSLSRVPVLFMFWPSSESSLMGNATRVASFGLFWPFMLGGVIMFMLEWMAGRSQAPNAGAVLLLFTLAYCLIHIVSWALVRYRLPVDAVWLVFAARALVALLNRIRVQVPLPAAPRSA